MSLRYRLRQIYTQVLKKRARFPFKAGVGVTFPLGSRIGAPIDIGDYTQINGKIVIKGRNPVRIGRYCAVGWDVRILSSNHNLKKANLQERLQRDLGLSVQEDRSVETRIGHNVWIGDAVVILPGVTVGNGAVIGAGAVVSRDIPPYAIAVGVPARLTGMRFEEGICDQLEKIGWWNWGREKILKHRALFALEVDSAESLLPYVPDK